MSPWYACTLSPVLSASVMMPTERVIGGSSPFPLRTFLSLRDRERRRGRAAAPGRHAPRHPDHAREGVADPEEEGRGGVAPRRRRDLSPAIDIANPLG